MSTVSIFRIHLGLGYLTWLLCIMTYMLPKLKTMDQPRSQRVIATIHSFRFFGLVFLMPGVVGQNLPEAFAVPTAYGDVITSLLAIMALLTFRVRILFWLFIVVFNVVGTIDLILGTIHAVQNHLGVIAGELGAAYVIPILYVPVLMITHGIAFYLMLTNNQACTSKLK